MFDLQAFRGVKKPTVTASSIQIGGRSASRARMAGSVTPPWLRGCPLGCVGAPLAARARPWLRGCSLGSWVPPWLVGAPLAVEARQVGSAGVLDADEFPLVV